MKTPKEYSERFEFEEEVIIFNWIKNATKDDLLNIIKQVQIDTIKETCKRCAEEADWDDLGDGDLHGANIVIVESSILNVADKLIKELEL